MDLKEKESNIVVYHSKIEKNKITIYNAGKFGEETLILNKTQAVLLLIDLYKFLSYDGFELKLDSQNQITIRKQKDSWSREEIIAIFEKARIDIMDMTFDGDFPECYVSKEELFEWIEENL